MALDIAQLKAAFAKKSESSGGENTGFWDKFYPFYKMDFDQTVVWRFLPDLDEENPLGFIIENKYHKLKINGQDKRVACLSMYGEQCPACELSRKFYAENNTTMGLMFWKKTDWVAQGIPLVSPFDYPIAAEDNPVRMISLAKKLYKKVEMEIVKGDMDEIPWDLVNGYNFDIRKTKQGEYADYTNSSFARKSTPVPETMLDRIKLYDLKQYRYAKIEREQMEAMIESALTGKSYENEKQATGGAAAVEAATSTVKPTQPAETVVANVSAPATPAASPAGAPKLSAAEILRKLKERSAAQQAK